MAEAMAYVEVPGYGTLIPISEVERVVAERDRYREALEKLADLYGSVHGSSHPVVQIAREALDA